MSTRDALHWAVEVSARAQRAATREQADEFAQLLKERAQTLVCIGCKRPSEFRQWGEGTEGYFNDAGLMVDRFGYGSSKFDMAKVAVLVCDDCAEQYGITSDWLDKLHKHWEVERKLSPPWDFQI